MSERFYKDKLYPLQDRVLERITGADTSFYLTGGTFLSRFLLNHRYSDDLDFFVNEEPDFRNKVDKVIHRLESEFVLQTSVKEDSFVRIYISQDDTQLKVEFINDVKYRVGVPVIKNGLLLDTWENVLSNKISALSRDSAKDFVDILFLSFTQRFNWESMIKHGKQKDSWVDEIEVSQRLMHFKIETLDQVKFLKESDRSKIKEEHFKILAKEALHGFDNTLIEKNF